MKHLLLPLLLLAAPSAVELVWNVPAGTEFTRTVRTEFTLGLEEFTSRMNGQEIPAAFLPELDVQVHSSSLLAVTERIEEATAGRPVRLRRTFDEVEVEESNEVTLSGESDRSVRRGRSPLEGRTVRFAWDEDAEAYERSLVDDETDVALDGLLEDLDLRGLLPEEEVEIGDTWELEPALLGALETPGGDLAWEWDGDPFDEDPELDEGWSGEVEATFTGWATDAEGRIAVIGITGEISREYARATDLEHVPVADGPATETTRETHELEAELRWDVEGGRLREFALASTVSMRVTTAQDSDDGGPAPFESTLLLTGTWEVEIEIGE